jgi:hypothetical protein
LGLFPRARTNWLSASSQAETGQTADLKHEERHVDPHEDLIDPVSLSVSSGFEDPTQLTTSAVTKRLMPTELGTRSMMMEKVSQRLASANQEKTRLKRLYW